MACGGGRFATFVVTLTLQQAACSSAAGGALRGTASDRSQSSAPAGSARSARPSWCDFVPEPFQGAACGGSEQGCACKDWCERVPRDTWESNPECCGCERHEEPVHHPHGDDGQRVEPAWCRFVLEAVKAEACQDCACQDWCEDVPLFAQKWSPACCGCTTDEIPSPGSHHHHHHHHHDRHHHHHHHEHHALDNTSGEYEVPAWCDFVPEEFEDEACSGNESSCECQDWCYHTPPHSHRWSPECCGCDSDEVLPEEGDSSFGLSNSSDREVPAWCELVPEGFQDEACHGSGRSCECKDWCQLTPSHSLKWNPECCGCGDDETFPSPRHSARDAPAWCEFVPEDFKDEACSGSGRSCECRDWCSETPMHSREWNPECCGCGDDVSSPRRDVSGVVPGWCDFVPDEFQDEACHGTGRSCECHEWCMHTPWESREWHPACCGCGHEHRDEPRHAPREVPGWCDSLPQEFQDEACRGSDRSCECREWCEETPAVSHEWNRACCGCHSADIVMFVP